jgi:hypothetical protein
LDDNGQEACRVNWSNGWVSSYDLGAVNGSPDGEGSALEILEITVEEIFPG